MRLLHRIGALLRGHSADGELDEELQYHLDQQIAQNLARGMPADAARTAALRRLGGATRRKDEMRDARGVNLVENLLRDARHALRTLRRSPGYSAVALITLALGLGANTAIFTVVNAVLFRPLAYRDADRLAVVSGTASPANFLDWRAEVRSFEAMGAAEYWTPTLTGSGDPVQIQALHLSEDILPLLGVAPVMGRVPSPEESQPGRGHVAVLSYTAWKNRFAADRAILGRSVTLNGEPYTVIGVMPDGFRFAPYWATQSELWSPISFAGRATSRTASSLRVFGRLAPGVSLAQAQAEMDGVAGRIEQDFPGTNQHVELVALQEMVVGDVRPALMVLFGAVGLVLLIACANVAHLQLLRAAARERESAVRTALGASRARLVQQSLVESLMLSLGGALLGLAVAWGGVRLVVALGPASLPRLDTIRIDGAVFGYLLTAALISSVVFGIGPALRASGVPTGEALKEGSRSSSESPRRRRVRGALVVSEFATALVLLVGATLLIRSFVALAGVDPGFDRAGALTLSVSLSGTAHADPARRAVFFADLADRMRALPGVRAVGAINHLPIAGDNWRFSFAIDGRPIPPPNQRPRALFRVARPGYFAAMGTPLVRGRDLTVQDEAGAARVVLINETMARANWPGEDAIGKRITVGDPASHADWFAVVGVVKDMTQAHLGDERIGEMYFPYTLDPALPDSLGRLTALLHPAQMMFVVRSAGDAAVLARPVRDLVRSLDGSAAVADVATLDQVVATQFTTPTFYLILLGAFAGVAVLLAAVGVYGVISYSAARRSHEMGVRLALGAAPDEPFRLVAGEGLRLAAIGGVLGLGLAMLLAKNLRTLLFGVAPNDPLMFALAAAALAIVAMAACWFPARRASRVDPMTALRCE